MRRPALLLAFGLAPIVAFSCSLQNQEGPEVDCAALECGRINACVEGIIAQCVNGETVRYHVCGTTDICTAEWQTEGQYRCAFEDTDCEGCRPERTLGCAATIPQGGDGPGGGGASAGGSGGAGGAGGS